MFTLRATLALIALNFCTMASASEGCEAVELSAAILNSVYGGSSSSVSTAKRRVVARWRSEIDHEIARQRLSLQMLSGAVVPPEQFPWQVDEVRYLCTPNAVTKSIVTPQRCQVPTDNATRQAMENFRLIVEENILALSSAKSNLDRCGSTSPSKNRAGFNLLDGPGENLSIESSGDFAEPTAAEGRIYWSSWMIEKTPEISQTTRDSLQTIWQSQVMDLFKEFSALNLENGQNLKSDVKLIQEGEVSVLYREGQRVLAFYKPQGVYVRVFMEVPYQFRNQLAGASAVNLMLKRTTLGNYAVYEYSQAPSIAEAQDSAFIERSIFQLEALDQKAEELFKSISTITKGMEAGLERTFSKAKMRYKMAASIMWLPGRVIGGGLGFLLGTSLAPMFSEMAGPQFVGAVPGIFLLSGMMMFTKSFEKLSALHEKILNFVDKDRGNAVKRLAMMEAQRQQLLEFRANVGLLRMDLGNSGSCRNLLKGKVSDLVEQGRKINGL